MRRSVFILATGLAVALVPAATAVAAETPGQAEAGDRAGQAVAEADFDGDGFADLAIGAPGEAIGTLSGAGAVTVVYGSAGGLAEAGGQLWSQDTGGTVDIGGVAEAGDQFGAVLAAGDFDGDGFADLAVGAPGEDGGAADTGAVNVIYGSASGLTVTGNQLWQQGLDGIAGDHQAGDQFGSALAAGDFDGDNRDDLAVGVPLDSVTGLSDAGLVNVIYGSASGLSAAADQLWNQASDDIGGAVEAGDRFGAALTAGDFDGDNRDDLAVGVPFEDGMTTDTGAVNVIYGSTAGLTAAENRLWQQGLDGIAGDHQAGDRFGSALVAGDFDGNNRDDLAIGVPFDSVDGRDDAGIVNIVYGSTNGLTASGNQLWQQDADDIAGEAEAGDRFGFALAAANFGRSAAADLAVGVPLEDGAATDSGAVNVIYGSASGLAATGNRLWQQGSDGVADASETGDAFGQALAAANVGRTTQADLAIGVPFEDVGSPVLANAGAVTVIYGTADGLTDTGDQFWTQGLP